MSTLFGAIPHALLIVPHPHPLLIFNLNTFSLPQYQRHDLHKPTSHQPRHLCPWSPPRAHHSPRAERLHPLVARPIASSPCAGGLCQERGPHIFVGCASRGVGEHFCNVRFDALYVTCFGGVNDFFFHEYRMIRNLSVKKQSRFKAESPTEPKIL